MSLLNRKIITKKAKASLYNSYRISKTMKDIYFIKKVIINNKPLLDLKEIGNWFFKKIGLVRNEINYF